MSYSTAYASQIAMLNCVHKCLLSESLLVNFVVRHGILHGQTDSIVGRNLLHCCERYHTIKYRQYNQYGIPATKHN